MTRFHYLDLTELATLIRTRELSPVAITEAQLERIAPWTKPCAAMPT